MSVIRHARGLYKVEKTRDKNKRKVTTYGSNNYGEFTRRQFLVDSDTNFNTVNPMALAELSNAGLVYILGGTPTYIHSTEVYFQSGLSTANAEMQQMVEQLAAQQKARIQEEAKLIDERWIDKMSQVGYQSTSAHDAFQHFKEYWSDVLNNKNNNDFVAAMMVLQKLKTAMRSNNLQEIIRMAKDSAKNLTGSGSYSEAGRAHIESLLKPFSDKFVVVRRGKGYSIQSQGAAEDLTALVIKHTQEILDIALRSVGGDINKLQKQLPQKIYDELLKSKGDVSQVVTIFSDAELGNLFETLSTSITESFTNNEGFNAIGDKVAQLFIENAAGEKHGKSTIKYKTDSIIKLLNPLNLDVIIDIPTSDKLQQVMSDIIKEEPGMISMAEKWGADLNLAHLDVSNMRLENFSPYADNFNALLNYVFKNFAAFPKIANSAEGKRFKELIVAFVAWLKIVNEIIGDPAKDEDKPMLVRSLQTVYNTADLLRKFLPVSGQGIIHTTIDYQKLQWQFLNAGLKIGMTKNSGKDLKWINFTLNPDHAAALLESKRQALDNLSSKGTISYVDLYAELDSVLKNFILNNNFGSGQGKLNFPALSTKISLDINNFKTLLQI